MVNKAEGKANRVVNLIDQAYQVPVLEIVDWNQDEDLLKSVGQDTCRLCTAFPLHRRQ